MNRHPLDPANQSPLHSSNQRPSKSQRKRDVQALQTLGEKLIELSPAELATLPLSDVLHQAVMEARRLVQGGVHARSALKRQRQYIGRLMREEPQTAEIQAGVDRLEQNKQAQTDEFHQLEQWREKLLTEGETAIQSIREHFPGIQATRIRSLLNESHVDNPATRKAAARKLFRYLRSVLIDNPAKIDNSAK